MDHNLWFINYDKRQELIAIVYSDEYFQDKECGKQIMELVKNWQVINLDSEIIQTVPEETIRDG